MGLDMYAYCTEAPILDVDFDQPDDAREIAYWRQRPDLHGWMEALYRSRDGGALMFNCVTVRLTPDDIDALEQAVVADDLPHVEGFFFGESMPEDKEDDLAFIAAVRERFAVGKSVYYSSWW